MKMISQVKPCVLMIDDDQVLLQSVQLFLQRHYFEVVSFTNGREAMAYLAKHTVDLIILDKLLEQEDGTALSKNLRDYSRSPILMLTGVHEEIEHIVALESGIDQYLTKPFQSRVLLAHIRAMLRVEKPEKCYTAPKEEIITHERIIYQFDGWQLNVTQHTFYSKAGELVTLTAGEYSLLLALVTHPNRVLSREQLLDLTQKDDEPFDRSIDTLISRLRRKLGSSSWIKTIRNEGYLFDITVSKIMEKE